MPLFLVTFLATHADLSTKAAKLLLWVMAIASVIVIAGLGFHSASSYLANERAVAVELARRAATAEVAAKVNAASEDAIRAQAADMAAGMDRLNARKAADDAVWASFNQTLQEIDSATDESDYAPHILNDRPYAAPAPAAKQPAPGNGSAFDAFVRADAGANRLLERATAGAP